MKWHRSLALAFALLAATASTALASSLTLPAEVYDANKPFPVALNDLSCWIASAANLLAADDWDNSNQNDLYAKLEANAAFQNGTGWRGGFQSEALNYAIQNFGLGGLGLNLPGYDGTEVIEVYNNWRKAWAEPDTPKVLLDKLLDQPTGPEDGANPATADDPVGIAFHYDGPGTKIAHAVTAWTERVLDDGTKQLGITDSDDGVTAVMYFTWINDFTLNYYGRPVTVDYMVALREGDDVPNGDFTLNIGDLTDGPPDLPAPEPATLVLLGTGLMVVVRLGKRRLRRS